MSARWIPALIPMLPLVAAIGAFVFPRAARSIGLVASVVLFPITGCLALLVWRGGALTQSVGGWVAPLGIHLRADGLAVLLLLAVSVVGLLVSVYAGGYFGPARASPAGRESRHFWPLWLFLLASLSALFLSGDAFNLYVTLELNGLSAVALVALAGNRAALGAALRYLFVSLSGSLSYLMGVALLYGAYGTVDLALLAERVTAEPHSQVALALMTGGLMMKSALFPMHFWLPPAHSSAPAPVSFLRLTWPRRAAAGEEHGAGMWAPWLCLVGAVMLGVWLLPGALGWLPAKLTPQKLWLATWPLLVGGGLAALGTWLRRWFSGDPSRWLPEGDVGVLLEKAVAAARSRTRARPATDHAHDPGESPATVASSRQARAAAVGARLDAIERRLGDWPVAGFALLVSMALMLWLLTEPGS